MATRAKKVKKTKRAKKTKRVKKKPATLPGTDIKILPALVPLLAPIDDVKPDPANPRITRDLETLKGSISRFGVRKPIVVNEKDSMIEAGHQTHAALKELGAKHIPVAWANDDRLDAVGFNIADNRSSEVVADWDGDALAKLLSELRDEDETAIVGWEGDALDEAIKGLGEDGGEGAAGDGEQARKTLAEEFVIPPFSVLDARQGYWQERKRAWIGLGIRSEIGRGENADDGSQHTHTHTHTDK